MKIAVVFLAVLHLSLSAAPPAQSTLKVEVPLYIRQSWLKLVAPKLSSCICESEVNAAVAYSSIIDAKLSNIDCLKCFHKCLDQKLNLMDATTGDYIEKEMLRQVEGVTPEIFKKCNDLVKNEVDLCQKSFNMYMCVIHNVAVPKTPAPYSH